MDIFEYSRERDRLRLVLCAQSLGHAHFIQGCRNAGGPDKYELDAFLANFMGDAAEYEKAVAELDAKYRADSTKQNTEEVASE
jgi:hypothetical protein